MKNKQIHNVIKYIVLAFVLLVVTVFSGGVMVPAFAVATEYTNVLDDLKKDVNFNVADYPVQENDNSVRVIQIAESTTDELFIYTYQPSCNSRLRATSVNISVSIGAYLNFENFELEQLSINGTLAKYRVLDFYSIKDTFTRTYEISSIYRNWYNGIDGEPENDNTVSEKSYAVGQKWTAVTIDGETLYKCEEFEVLDVTKQFVHYIRYDEGFQSGGIKSCDAHYFAFNCERNIDRLISADLLFYTQEYKRMAGQDEPKLLASRTRHYITVTSEDKGSSNKEEWQRLSGVTEFLSAGHKISNDEREKLKNYDWIINFYETEYERDVGGKDVLISMLVPGGFIWTIVNACTTYGTLVTDVTLMRLEFEYAGKIYNLGVVSDKQTGSIFPPIPDRLSDMPWWVWFIIAIVALIVLVIVLQVLGLFFPVIKTVFGALWWLICLPFRGIKALIEKIRGDE